MAVNRNINQTPFKSRMLMDPQVIHASHAIQSFELLRITLVEYLNKYFTAPYRSIKGIQNFLIYDDTLDRSKNIPDSFYGALHIISNKQEAFPYKTYATTGSETFSTLFNMNLQFTTVVRIPEKAFAMKVLRYLPHKIVMAVTSALSSASFRHIWARNLKELKEFKAECKEAFTSANPYGINVVTQVPLDAPLSDLSAQVMSIRNVVDRPFNDAYLQSQSLQSYARGDISIDISYVEVFTGDPAECLATPEARENLPDIKISVRR